MGEALKDKRVLGAHNGLPDAMPTSLVSKPSQCAAATGLAISRAVLVAVIHEQQHETWPVHLPVTACALDDAAAVPASLAPASHANGPCKVLINAVYSPGRQDVKFLFMVNERCHRLTVCVPFALGAFLHVFVPHVKSAMLCLLEMSSEVMLKKTTRMLKTATAYHKGRPLLTSSDSSAKVLHVHICRLQLYVLNSTAFAVQLHLQCMLESAAGAIYNITEGCTLQCLHDCATEAVCDYLLVLPMPMYMVSSMMHDLPTKETKS